MSGSGFMKGASVRIVGTLIGVVGAVLTLVKPPTPVASPTPSAIQGVVTARRFSLKDDRGMERAALGFSEKGNPEVALFDSSGEKRATLVLQGDNYPILSMSDRWHGPPRLVIGLQKGPGPSLCFINGSGKAIAAMGVGASDSPEIALSDPDGTSRMGMSFFGDGAASLYVSGPSGQGSAGLLSSSDGCGLSLSGHDGKRRATLKAPTNGKTTLRLFDANGNQIPAH